MLGMTLVCELTADRSVASVRELGALIPQASTLVSRDGILLAAEQPAGYPLRLYETPTASVIVEGKTYGVPASSLPAVASALAADVLAREGPRVERIRDWLRSTDGDFVIAFIERTTGRVAVMTDLFGRLPVYWARSRNRLVLSRSLRVAGHLTDHNESDPMAVAQMLLFSYPLGPRTLLRNVSRLPAASILIADPTSPDVRLQSVHRFSFDLMGHDGTSVEENVERLGALLRGACDRRCAAADEGAVVLCLSGGLDSRAVAAALKSAPQPIHAATRLDARGRATEDARGAEQVAALLDLDWRLYRLSPMTGADALELLILKDGMNPLGMGMMLRFLRCVKEQMGTIGALFTGDGGDKILPDLLPGGRPRDLDNLVRLIIDENHVLPLDQAAAIAGIPPGDIRAEIQAVVSDYPEETPGDRYVHFLVYERAHKFLFEGEDRNRSYGWSVTPFYAPDVFEYAMGCDQRRKSRYYLYRRLLRRMGPEVCGVTNPGWGCPVESRRTGALLLTRELFRKLPRRVRQVLRKPEHRAGSPGIVQCLLEQVARSRVGREQLRIDETWVRAASREHVEALFTVTSALERFSGRESTLERYLDVEME